MKCFFLQYMTLACVLSIDLQSKIYDCFTFFNELELLNIRFEELYDSVDYFVLVEATETFTGFPKPLYFAENRFRFEKYRDKIIHVIVRDMPAITENPVEDRWIREAFSRDCIFRGLQGCKEDDIIFISDLDEIPKSTAVTEIEQYLTTLNRVQIFQKRKIPYHQFVCCLDMSFFTTRLNLASEMIWQFGSKAVPYWLLKVYSPWEIKVLHHKYTDFHLVKNAGWHFHSMGGVQRVQEKLHAIYEYEPQDIDHKAELFIDWTNLNYASKVISIDDSYPRSIVDNIDYFRNLGWILE